MISTNVAESDSSSPSALVSPKSSVPSPNPQMISSKAICTMKLAAESIALTPTAMPEEPPTRWKNRIITASRPTALGTARPM